jgi:hypothetical protein
MKFRYIISNMYEGCLQGTNDPTVAESNSMVEEFFVYDTEKGVWLVDGEETEIKDIEEYKNGSL